MAYNPFPGSAASETIGYMRVELVIRMSDKIIPGYEDVPTDKPNVGIAKADKGATDSDGHRQPSPTVPLDP